MAEELTRNGALLSFPIFGCFPRYSVKVPLGLTVYVFDLVSGRSAIFRVYVNYTGESLSFMFWVPSGVKINIGDTLFAIMLSILSSKPSPSCMDFTLNKRTVAWKYRRKRWRKISIT